MTSISLSNKVAIITGTSSGMGLAMVPVFLEAGAKGVVGVFRRTNIPPELEQCKETFGDKLQIVPGDVADESCAKAFTETALKQFGRIDIMINNAAQSIVKALHEHTEEDWDAVINTNVKAIFWSGKYVIPVMMKNGGGVIINSGSISGEVGIPTQGAYGPSKGAIHQMTRQMAIEYAPYKIRVNAICCGTVDTPIVHRSAEASGDPETYWKMLRDGHPIGRIATVEEVAKFYLYMSSDDASFFTGSIIMMDGGFTAQ